MSARVAALCAAAAFACAPGPEPAAPPTIVVISLDTVRADRLGCYGAEGASTPNFDALAARADRYASCTAPSPWTLPSHASLFTGLYPFEHGTHGFRVDSLVENAHPLHPDHDTLAEMLAASGYETAGFAANTVYLAPRYGAGQGFDTYEVARKPAFAMTGRALEFVDARESNVPLFLFVNYMDAHRPYAAYPPEEMAALPRERNPAERLEALCRRVLVDGEPAGELGDEVSALYDRALTRLDAEVGRLLDGLDERGVLEGALVVVTSDHGEAFGEHMLVEHGKDVYEPVVAVPLIVKSPGQTEGRVVDTPASLVDVAGLCAAAVPGENGAALREAFSRTPGTHAVVTEVHFARPRDIVLYADRFQHERTALRDGRFKLIVGGPSVELYDLAADPGESTNLASSDPQRVESMRAELDRLTAEGAYRGERLMPKSPTAQQSAEIDELGYGGR